MEVPGRVRFTLRLGANVLGKQRVGTALPATVRMRTALSNKLPLWTAAYTPAGIPTSNPSNMAAPMSVRVAGSRSATISVTGRCSK